jgi:hypothetical protein
MMFLEDDNLEEQKVKSANEACGETFVHFMIFEAMFRSSS